MVSTNSVDPPIATGGLLSKNSLPASIIAGVIFSLVFSPYSLVHFWQSDDFD